jgi:hypothetical protein
MFVVFSKTSPAMDWSPGERTAGGWFSTTGASRTATTVLRALVVGILAPLLLRARPERLARLLEPRRAVRPQDDEELAGMLRLTDVTLARGRPFVRTGCLTRGVTRYWMLRRAGAEVALCFGVGSVAGNVEAHCWIAQGSTPILEPPDVQQFHEMFRICRPGIVRAAT